jgi:hypothetical protein
MSIRSHAPRAIVLQIDTTMPQSQCLDRAVQCVIRRRLILRVAPGVATCLRDVAQDRLDPSSRKLRVLCRDDIVLSIESGRCGRKLFAILSTFVQTAFPDIQEIESINSMIKSQCKRSPNMSL